MSEKRVSVPAEMATEVHAQLSEYAEAYGMPLGDFLVMAALDRGLVEMAINWGFEIFGRNETGEEITYTEILYGPEEDLFEKSRTKLSVVKPTSSENINFEDTQSAAILEFRLREK